MDGPQWQLHYLNGFVDPDDGVSKTLVLWKQHHSFCDGISAMCMLLGFSADYDRSYFVGGPDATLL